jgi:polyhydroxyalkanoate synthesis repressor PhaR
VRQKVVDVDAAARHTRRMAYVIKRYSARKLYDTRTKRYLTLDEVATLVRAGEEVKVEDADTGDDLTAQVLAKIVAEGGRGGQPLVPQGTLVDMIRWPGELVLDAVKSSVSAGQRTVEQMSGEIGKIVGTVSGYADKGRKQVEGVGDEIARVVERRLRALLAEMNVATRDDLVAIETRLSALESAAMRARRGAAAKSATRPRASKKSERSRTPSSSPKKTTTNNT